MDYSQIIIRPLITEKTTAMKEKFNQVVFYVNPRANKVEIKGAVEKAFHVSVKDVRVACKKSGERTRQGRVVGKIAGYKKAYVTLAEDAKIEFFEGV
ncbi:50S ribosomal protein L23 [Deltaproteobacteria bacterium]|nr:50S ribosomal protein L23 [Deltaproteobacteria bacterium]